MTSPVIDRPATPATPQPYPGTTPDGRRHSGHAAPPRRLQTGSVDDTATAAISVDGVSKWYGDVVAVSDVSFSIGPGVTALLGPNGAGKSTLLKMISGLLATSGGDVRVFGASVRGNPAVYRRIGLVPEQEDLYPALSAREFVRLNAILQKVPDADAATDRALGLVEMRDVGDRRLAGFSKGMRQRIKVAAALVHDPDVLVMDEPLNGTDPVQRASLISLIETIGESGRTVLVSSHVLEEVERFAGNIVVIVNGKLAAAGDFRAIRDKIDAHPHQVRIRASDPRRMAAALIADPATVSVEVDREGVIQAQTANAHAFYTAVPRVARGAGIHLLEIQPADESLNSVFAYLVER